MTQHLRPQLTKYNTFDSLVDSEDDDEIQIFIADNEDITYQTDYVYPRPAQVDRVEMIKQDNDAFSKDLAFFHYVRKIHCFVLDSQFQSVFCLTYFSGMELVVIARITLTLRSALPALRLIQICFICPVDRLNAPMNTKTPLKMTSH